MRVRLLCNTPDPERTVALAARMCYSEELVADLVENTEENLTSEECATLIKFLFRVGHFSVFEHASFTFAIDGVSRALSHQLVRHRIASYAQKSQRRTSMDHPRFVIPPSVEESRAAVDAYTSVINSIVVGYNDLKELGVPLEDARFLLPNACETALLVTMNARSLFNFFSLRCCSKAQWEIRGMADEMLKLCKEVAPIIFEKAGPTCVTLGTCRENKPCKNL